MCFLITHMSGYTYRSNGCSISLPSLSGAARYINSSKGKEHQKRHLKNTLKTSNTTNTCYDTFISSDRTRTRSPAFSRTANKILDNHPDHQLATPRFTWVTKPSTQNCTKIFPQHQNQNTKESENTHNPDLQHRRLDRNNSPPKIANISNP